MPDKPNPAFHLPGHAVIALAGPDATAFAQAQFMSDVASLADGHWQWSGWLTPQGRVVALFALVRRDPQLVWLVVAVGQADALAQGLARYVFRSKLSITTLPLACNGRFASPSHAQGSRTGMDGDAVELDMGGDGGPRALRIETEASAGDAEQAEAWLAFDLAHGLPRLAGEPKWTPQQLSLERLRAFSVRKGCYPGQEIVARTHFLGQAKRELALFEAGAPLQAGEVLASGEARGAVVSAAGTLALAVIASDAPHDGWIAGTAPLQRRPLLDGLAR